MWIVLPPGDPIFGDVAMANRESSTAPSAMTTVIDEALHIVEGSALDMQAWRQTAKPAGSRGRITASGRQLLENGVSVKFNIAHYSPENTFVPLPDKAGIDAGVVYLARQGYNCIRIMGIEHLAMRGVSGAVTFLPEPIDRFQYLLAACKREGIYVVLCVMSNNLYVDLAGSNDRYAHTASSTCKPRMFTEQNIRENWLAGFNALYNTVNRYTGINILQDPSIVLVELYNEASAIFCASKGMPAIWQTARNAGASAAAQIWPEWLANSGASHGYANLAALNASWGSAHASYAAAAASALPFMDQASLTTTAQNLDYVLYLQYLEDHLASWYAAAVASTGYVGLKAMHSIYPQLAEIREQQKATVNDVTNWHHYVNLTNAWVPDVPTVATNQPVWDYEYIGLMPLWAGGSKPVWLGEMGDVSFSKWRHQWPLLMAAGAASGAVASSFYTQADFFAPVMFDDPTAHGEQFSKLHAFYTIPSHVNDFVRVMQVALWCRGDIPELTGAAIDITMNDRHYGVSPRNPARLFRYLPGMLLPLYPAVALTKARINWAADTDDDTFAATWTPKTWLTVLTELRDAGAIAPDHVSLVSAQANNGNVIAIAVTGTVGGLAASLTQPVLTLGAAHTLVDNDVIHVDGGSGTIGNNFRNARIRVKVGTGNNVRAESGMNLTGYTVGAGTATWCEGANVLRAGNNSWHMSRREKQGWIDTTRTLYYTHSGAALPFSRGILQVASMTADTSLFVTSLDGANLSASGRLLIGLCGWAENTGMAFTDTTRTTMTSTGDYPVQHTDATAQIFLTVASALQWRLYRLRRNGQRETRESQELYDATNGRLKLLLRTGTVYPAVFFELVRQ